MKTAIYPGTFDPITNGHLDVIERARDLFDVVIVTVATNTAKTPVFSIEERLELVRGAVEKYSNVRVDTFSGLLVDYARQVKAQIIIRGLRAITDFDYEFQMALVNRKLDQDITTVFLMPHEKYTYLNSTIIRELAQLHGEYRDFVPENVHVALQQRFPRK